MLSARILFSLPPCGGGSGRGVWLHGSHAVARDRTPHPALRATFPHKGGSD